MNYKILWIDDNQEWVDSIKGEVCDHINEHRFSPEIIYQEDAEQIDSFIYRADIDMIVVDYNLDGTSGDQVIKNIREKGNFLEIIFYSQDPEVMLNKLNVHSEHIHCSERSDVAERIKAIINYSIYKYANLSYMRGSVIEEAIDIENILVEIMVNSFGGEGKRFKVDVLDKLGTAYDLYKKYMYVQRLVNATHRALSEKENRSPEEDSRLVDLKEYKDTLSKFSKEVVDNRNVLAHAQKHWDAEGRLRLKGLNKNNTIIDVSREWMMEMRSILAKYRGLLIRVCNDGKNWS